MSSKKNAPDGVLEIDVALIRAVLADVAGVVEARNTIPILSNVVLAVTPTSLTVTSTDLDVWVSRHASIEAANGFTVTAEVSTLRRIVDKLPADARCVMTAEDGQLAIVAGRSRFKIPTLPSDDFPHPVTPEWAAEFEMPALLLAGAFDRIAHAISTEETRYYLNGVFMHAKEAELRLATTDGHRLARMTLPLPDGAVSMPDVIVPRKVVKLLDGLLDRHEGSIDVSITTNRIRFDIGETVVDAKLIDGTYPDYQRVIPAGHENCLSIDRETLVAALGRVITVADGKSKVVKAEFARDVLTLSVSSHEKGQGSEELPCEWSGNPLTVGFNAKFLLDTLNQLTAISIEGRFGTSEAPTLWRDDEGSPALFVVMPHRV